MASLTKRIVVIVLLQGLAVAYGQQGSAGPPRDRLFTHIYGAVAGAFIGNAMGEPAENWTWEKIEQTYGFVDKFFASTKQREPDVHVPQRFGPDWVYKSYQRQAGWTEDGMERYKLLASAVIRKGGRVNVEDLAKEWTEKIDPNKIGYHIGPQDAITYDLLKAGIPPYDAGRYTTWTGGIASAKMASVFGIVNACRPDNAARDALDACRIRDSQGPPNDFALEVAAAVAAGTAEALRPGATVDSIIQVALAQLPDLPLARQEVQHFLDLTREAKDYKDLRVMFADSYKPRSGRLQVSGAIETLAGGLASFRLAKGDPRESVTNAINTGRDTDCKAYVAGSLAGALKGIDAWPPEWVETVEKAILTDTYTLDKRDARHLAKGLYTAALNEHAKAKAADSEVDSLLAK